MSADERFARLLGDVLADGMPSSPPDRLLPETLRVLRRAGRWPRWLALLKEPPMRISSRVAVGSPRLRLSVAVGATALLIVLLLAVGALGASLRPEPTATNGLIAFDSADGNIYVADADGRNAHILIDLPNEVRGPSWSPDGTRLAYYEIVEQSPITNDKALAHVFDVTDGSDVEITGGVPVVPALYSPSMMSASGPVWSPDGTQVGLSVRGGDPEQMRTMGASILVAQADGSGVSRLPLAIDATDPAWSPDGTWIAFHGQNGMDMTSAGVYVVRPNGTDLRQVAGRGSGPHNMYSDDGAFSSPQWSPSGDTILYYSWDGATYGTSDQDASHVYVIGVDGSAPRAVLHEQQEDWWPSWSPDGRLIAFQRLLLDENGQPVETGGLEIHVMNPDGSGLRQLDVGPGNGAAGPLIWAPDGSALLTITWTPDNADGLAMTRPTIVSLDPSVPPIVISDPGGVRPKTFSGWAGLSWQHAP